MTDPWNRPNPTGDACAWCGAPAVQDLQVQPSTKRKGGYVKPSMVPVCAEHLARFE